MPPTPMHPLETIERARQMYREGARVRDICAATGISVGTLYYHLDGFSLPGLVPPRLPRRRDVEGNAEASMPSRGRRKLAARLFRAAEQQARKIEMRLSLGHQRLDQLPHDLQALRELSRILRELSTFEDSALRSQPQRTGGAAVEHEQALAVEGRAVYLSRTRRR